MLDRTNHNRLSEEATRRIADKYIPAAGRQVTAIDNQPPEPVADEAAVQSYAKALMVKMPAIEAAKDHVPLLKAFIADNPVFQNAEDLQIGGAWIESTRRTLAALEDERKPKVAPLNVATNTINEPYRAAKKTLEDLLPVVVDRWNKGEKAERQRREAIAEAVRLEAEEAARVAQALIDQANDAIAAADVGACEDVGTAVVDAKVAMHEANVLDRTANRADNNTRVRVASQLGGRALAPRERAVIVIDDLAAAIEAIGPVENILIAVRQSAKAFKEANGKLPKGCREDYTRSI
jgi:hypothetical protein